MNKVLFNLTLIVLVLSSCLKDDYDLNNLNTQLTPTYAVPLATAKIKTLDVLKALDSTALSSGEDGLLSLVYSDTLASFRLNDIVQVPTQTMNYSAPVGKPIDVEDRTFSNGISLFDAADNFEEPYRSFLLGSDGQSVIIPATGIQDIGIHEGGNFSEYQSLVVSQGTITATMTNGWPTDVDNFKIALINGSSNQPIDTLDFGYIPSGGSKQVITEVSGVTIENVLKVHIYSVELVGTAPNNVLLDLADEMSFQIDITNTQIVSGNATIPSQEVVRDTTTFDFALNNGEELERVLLKTGEITYDLSYELLESSSITISIPAAKKNNVSFTQTINIISDNQNPYFDNDQFDLTGYEIDLTKNGTSFNKFDVLVVANVISSGIPVPFDTANSVNLNLSIQNVSIQEVEGYFGDQIIEIAQDTAEVDLDNDGLLNHFEFIEPQVKVFIDNSFGLPIDIDPLSIVFKSSNDLINLTGIPTPFAINNPAAIGNTAFTELTINNQTTNIVDAINAGPNEVIVSGQAKINPSGRVNNFALDTSKIDFRIEVDVPLYAFVRDYAFQDTIELDLDNLLENLNSAKLRSIVTNDFPIEGSVQILFTDENYAIIDSVGDSGSNVIEAAPTDLNGNTTGTTKNITDFVLNVEQMERLKSSKHVIIKTIINTPQSGTVLGRVYEAFEIEVKLSLLAEVNVEL